MVHPGDNAFGSDHHSTSEVFNYLVRRNRFRELEKRRVLAGRVIVQGQIVIQDNVKFIEKEPETFFPNTPTHNMLDRRIKVIRPVGANIRYAVKLSSSSAKDVLERLYMLLNPKIVPTPFVIRSSNKKKKGTQGASK